MKYLTIALLALACNANAEPIAVVPIRGGEVTLTDTPCSGEAGQQANVRVLSVDRAGGWMFEPMHGPGMFRVVFAAGGSRLYHLREEDVLPWEGRGHD